MSNFTCNNSLFADLAAFFFGSSNLDCQCSYNPPVQSTPVQSTPTISSTPVATPSSGSEASVHLGIMVLLGTMVALIA
jgi:hypothetical protein